MRLVFLHIPKSGGSSFKQMFGVKTIKHGVYECDFHVCYHHKNLVEVSSAIDLSDRFTVAFVRNPYERFVSWYLYHLRNSDQQISFEYFLRDWLPENRNRGSCQHPYLFAEDCNVNWICRYEDFSRECRRVSRILGRRVSLQHRNGAPENYDYRDFYTPSLRRHVAQAYSVDVELLKYRF